MERILSWLAESDVSPYLISRCSRCQSLDDIFYYGGQKDHDEEAVQDNLQPTSEGEIAFRKGDILGIAGNHWDGFSKGINRRTKQRGLYPSFKTKEHVDAVDFGDFNV